MEFATYSARRLENCFCEEMPDTSVVMAMGYGWTAEKLQFDSRNGARDISLLHSVQTGSGAQPGSYPLGNGDSFSRIWR
jgi:hypothetical protein